MKQFDTKELQIIAQIINTASQRGLFQGQDMEAIGKLFNKIVSMLPKPEAMAEQDVKK